MTGVYNRAQENIDAGLRRRRLMIHSALATFKTMDNTVVNRSVADNELRQTLFTQIDPAKLARQIEAVDRLVTGKHSHVLSLVIQRFSCIPKHLHLLVMEEMHALARLGAYGKQGTIMARDPGGLRNTSSCLNLIMAGIIYWQATEINRVLMACEPAAAGVD